MRRMKAARDYSRAAFEARLGPDVMAEIDRSVEAAPPLGAEQVDQLRRIFTQAEVHRPAIAA